MHRLVQLLSCPRVRGHPGAVLCLLFFFNDTATTEIYTLSLHDALPICGRIGEAANVHPGIVRGRATTIRRRSEEHTSELQSRSDLVCRLLLAKKKTIQAISAPRTTSPAGLSEAGHVTTLPRRARGVFFFNDTATPDIYTLSLHDALPIWAIAGHTAGTRVYWLSNVLAVPGSENTPLDRKSTRLNSSHDQISYAVFCLKKKKNKKINTFVTQNKRNFSAYHN